MESILLCLIICFFFAFVVKSSTLYHLKIYMFIVV